MKKKYIMLVLFVLLAMSTLFVACDDNDGGSVAPSNHEHTFSAQWASDSTYHWHNATCEHTNVVADKMQHNFVNDICITCNHRRAHVHSYGAWQNVTESTCGTQGKNMRVCTSCGNIETETLPLLEHTWKELHQHDENYHWKQATCEHSDAIGFKEEHNWNEWNVTRQPTCGSDGSRYRSCPTCGYHQYESIPRLEHTFENAYTTTEHSHYRKSTCGHDVRADEHFHSFEWMDNRVYCSVCQYSAETTRVITDGSGVCTGIDTSYYGDIGPSVLIIPYGIHTIASLGDNDYGSVIQHIFFPDSIRSIDADAFSSCMYLSSVNITDIAKWCNIKFANEKSNPLYHARNLYLNGELVEDLVIPDSVTSIGSYAFYNCSSLTSITISDSVTSIGSFTFHSCSSLTSIAIPDSVTSIGVSAFSSCSSLTSIAIPDSVTSIGSYAFFSCSSLTSIAIPDSVTSIGSYAFFSCSSLTSVTFGNNSQLTSIGKSAFHGCSSLTSITIPEGITLIYDGTFTVCTSLTSIAIPDSATSIGKSAFSGCSSLTSVTFGDNSQLTSIGEYAFYNCSSLTSITIPESVTTIGEYAFYNCSSLTSITIPESVTTIGKYAFCDCTGLEEINFNATAMENLSSDNSVFYNAGQNGNGITVNVGANVTKIPEYLFYSNNYAYTPKITSVNFAQNSNCESIGLCAFEGCSSLTSVHITDISAWCNIQFGDSSANPLSYASMLYLNGKLVTKLVIPEGVTSIGECAFYNCFSLTSIIIPDSVRSIGSSAFEDCSRLTNVTFGDNSQLTLIDLAAFSDCSRLTSITIPDSVTYIGTAVFYGCSSLQYYEYDNGLYLGNENNNYHILVQAKDTSITSCQINEHTKVIGEYAFRDCTSLTSITIPDSVTSICSYAFYYCSSLQYYEYDNGLYLGNENNNYHILVQAKDTSITSCQINEHTKVIGEYAFYNCSNLTSVTFGDNSQLTSIGLAAFYGCSNLTSITIPDSVTSISSGAFYGCSNLQYYEYDNGLYLGNENNNYHILVQAKDTFITSCQINEHTKAIGSYAFYNCSNLTSVYYGGTVDEWSIISISSGNYSLTSATRYYYSETEPVLNANGTAYDGNYWHYVNGIPTVWTLDN